MTPDTYLIVDELAQAKGWTIAELARQAGISYSAARRAWQGGSPHTPSSTIAHLATALDVGLFDVIHPHYRYDPDYDNPHRPDRAFRMGDGTLDMDALVRFLRQTVDHVLYERFGLGEPLRAPFSDTELAQVQAIAAEIGPLPDVLELKAQGNFDSAKPVAVVLALTEYSHPAFYAAYQAVAAEQAAA